MKSTYVKDLGNVVTIDNVAYDKGRQKLAEIEAEFINARDLAYARTQVDLKHDLNRQWNWISEEVIYNLKGIKNPVIFLGQGPIYNNSEKATDAHRKGKEFYINDSKLVMPEDLKSYGKQWNTALAKLTKEQTKALKQGKISPLEMLAFELPQHESFEIPVEELLEIDADKLSNPKYFNKLSKEAQVAGILFKDQTQVYAEKLLNESGIEEVPVWLIGKDSAKKSKNAFSRSWYVYTLDYGSNLDGDYDLDDDTRLVGVQNAEGVAQKFEEFAPILESIKAGKGFEFEGKVYAPIDKKALDF